MKNFCFFFWLLMFSFCAKNNLEEDLNNRLEDKQTTILFSKTFGGSKNDVANAIIKTIDNGYAVVGYTQSNNKDITTKVTEDFDILLTKYTTDNNLEFSKTFGGLLDDRANSVIQTIDGGFAILGYSFSKTENILNNGSRDFWVLKTDRNGNLKWQKSFGFAGNDQGISIIQTNDQGFLLVGVLDITASNGKGKAKALTKKHAGGDFWVIKLTNSGELEWSNFYGGSFTDTPFDVVQTKNNSFIIVGSSDSTDVDITNNLGSYDFWVIHISNKGNLLWQKNFGGSQIDEAFAISASPDNNFLIVGDTRSSDKNVNNNNGGADIWLIKIDINGNLLWEKTIGSTGFDACRSIKLTSDNNFLISGSSRSTSNNFNNKGANDALLVKINANGNILWQKTVGGSKIDFFYDAIEIAKNNYIAVGETTSSDKDILINKGFSDQLIVKIKE